MGVVENSYDSNSNIPIASQMVISVRVTMADLPTGTKIRCCYDLDR